MITLRYQWKFTYAKDNLLLAPNEFNDCVKNCKNNKLIVYGQENLKEINPPFLLRFHQLSSENKNPLDRFLTCFSKEIISPLLKIDFHNLLIDAIIALTTYTIIMELKIKRF